MESMSYRLYWQYFAHTRFIGMQAPAYPWTLRGLIWAHPSLGGLLDLLEENYRILSRLIPDMRQSSGAHCSPRGLGLDLHLEVLEQTPYTTLLHLTYYFPHAGGTLPDPDTTLRVYHDAGQVEVMDLRQTALPLARGPHFPTLDQKWRANLFLSKWLSYCLSEGHYFPAAGQSQTGNSATDMRLVG